MGIDQKTLDISWTEFKNIVDLSQMAINFVQYNSRYYIKAKNDVFEVGTILPITVPANDDQLEFESDYKGTNHDLILSENVSALNEEVLSFTPPLGSTVVIKNFFAEAPFNVNCVCKLIWRYNAAGETLIWSTQGASKMPFQYVIPSSETDGTRKLAITCDNGTLNTILMSAFAKIYVIGES